MFVNLKPWVLALCALLTLLAVSAADAACSGNVCSTQGESAAACQATLDQADPNHTNITYNCVVGHMTVGSWNAALQCYVEDARMMLGIPAGFYEFYWCRVTCTPDQTFGAPGTQWEGDMLTSGDACDNGCYDHFNPDAVGSVCLDGTNCSSFGYFKRTGVKCYSKNITDPAVLPNLPKPCGSASCYDPKTGQYCGSTDAGEMVCVKGPAPGFPGACANGATGSICAGDPPPAPSDPPIPAGQNPDNTDTATTKNVDGSGNVTTNNTTVNNYNGTSTAPTPTTGDTSGAVGGSSNTSGSGNSGQTGTDSNGKCPDGSVPTASGCSGTFSDGGCDTPPACYGDAVLCGIGRETWALRCADQKGNDWLQKQAVDLAENPDPGPAPASSTVVSSVDLGDGSGTFNETGLGWDRTCPSNPTFTVYGKTFTLDLANMCHVMTICGSILLVIAYIVGLAIVSRGNK